MANLQAVRTALALGATVACALAFAVEPVPAELLEFLATWQDEDGQWLEREVLESDWLMQLPETTEGGDDDRSFQE